MKRKILLLTLLLALLLVNPAGAMSSDHYRLDWFVPLSGGGGGTAASANFSASYTIGQTFIGQSDSAQYSLGMGFWQGVLDHFLIWLSIILK